MKGNKMFREQNETFVAINRCSRAELRKWEDAGVDMSELLPALQPMSVVALCGVTVELAPPLPVFEEVRL